MKRKRYLILIVCGVLLLAAAAALTGYNLWDEERATESVEQTVTVLETAIPVKEKSEQLLIPEPQPVVPTMEIDDSIYVGILEIPALDLTLPIQSQCTDALLKASPCLYSGTLYDGMIIAGHNYKSHFAYLNRLNIGDEIYFTDVDGNVWTYTITTTEVISAYDVEAMEAGDWDLTLFTCTYGNRERFTLRCTMQVF